MMIDQMDWLVVDQWLIWSGDWPIYLKNKYLIWKEMHIRYNSGNMQSIYKQT